MDEGTVVSLSHAHPLLVRCYARHKLLRRPLRRVIANALHQAQFLNSSKTQRYNIFVQEWENKNKFKY